MDTVTHIPRKTLGMVLAGGKGSRLSPLTLKKPKPGVAFGGKYNVITSYSIHYTKLYEGSCAGCD